MNVLFKLSYDIVVSSIFYWYLNMAASEQAKLSSLADIIRKLNGTAEAALEVHLPHGGEHYYYSNFPAYSEPLKQGLSTIQRLLSTCESIVRSRRAPQPDWTDGEEVASWSSDLLDDVMEKIDSALDAERARLRRREAGPRGGGEESVTTAAPGAPDDVALMANLPCFGGSAVRASRHKAQGIHGARAPRPQDSFDPLPDNGREVPFRPRVDHLKGLTAEPCDPRVYQAAPGAPEEYSHPFAANLEALTYRPDQLRGPVEPPQPPPVPEDTPMVWVDSEETLAGMVLELEAAEELALDLEHHSHRSFQGFTCLMQISTRTTDYVVDTLALRNQLGPALARVFSDPRVVKVLHGADSDVEWLQRDFGLFLVNMFDTGQAARVLALPSRGLAYLLESLCGVTADKRFQLADWRIRPLTKDMLYYARCDTHYLLYIYDILREKLTQMPDGQIPPSLAVPLPDTNPGGALGLVLERSRQLCLKTYRKPAFHPDSYWELVQRWSLCLSQQQLSVFAALLDWRDKVSRVEDEGTSYVLSKTQLIMLAKLMPDSAKWLQSSLGPRGVPEVVLRRVGELVEVIKNAKHRPVLQRPVAAIAAGQGAADAPPAASGAPTADTTAAATNDVVTAAVTAGTAAQRTAPPPALKPRTVAPIRTGRGGTAAAAALAVQLVPNTASASLATTEQGGAAEAAAEEAPRGPAAAVMGSHVKGGVAAGAMEETNAEGKDELGAARAETASAGVSNAVVGLKEEEKSDDVGAAAGAQCATEGSGSRAATATATAVASASTAAAIHASAGIGLKPRQIAPVPIKSVTLSRSAVLFGGGGAAAATAVAATVANAASILPKGTSTSAPEETEDSKEDAAAAAASMPHVASAALAAADATVQSAAAMAAAPQLLPQPGPAAVGTVRRVHIGGSGARSGGASFLGSIFGGSSVSLPSGVTPLMRSVAQPAATAAMSAAARATAGDRYSDEEERMAQQRAKRLRATFTLPFVTAAAAAATATTNTGGSAGEAATNARDTAERVVEDEVPVATRAKPSTTAADIRSAVEAMRAEGEDIEIGIGADGQGVVHAPLKEHGGGGGDSGAAATATADNASGRVAEAPAVRTITVTNSDDDDNDGDGADDNTEGGEIAAAAAPAGPSGAEGGGGTGSMARRRVAGSPLGLDIIDFVPMPLSVMLQKKRKRGQGPRMRQSSGEAGNDGRGSAAGGSKRADVNGGGNDAVAGPLPKRRRFTTEVRPAAADGSDGDGGGDMLYGGEGSSDSDGDNDSGDAGHTVGPFAKKRPQKRKAQQKTKQQSVEIPQRQAHPESQQPRRGRGARPPPKGVQAYFPSTNISPPPAASERGRGRGGRDRGRGSRGRGGGSGRQPTAFNPYDIPDEFLMKGGKRSAVMPRSGNRTFTFK